MGQKSKWSLLGMEEDLRAIHLSHPSRRLTRLLTCGASAACLLGLLSMSGSAQITELVNPSVTSSVPTVVASAATGATSEATSLPTTTVPTGNLLPSSAGVNEGSAEPPPSSDSPPEDGDGGPGVAASGDGGSGSGVDSGAGVAASDDSGSGSGSTSASGPTVQRSTSSKAPQPWASAASGSGSSGKATAPGTAPSATYNQPWADDAGPPPTMAPGSPSGVMGADGAASERDLRVVVGEPAPDGGAQAGDAEESPSGTPGIPVLLFLAALLGLVLVLRRRLTL